MNVNYHCDELISEIVMKFEETQEQFIFQTISDFTSNVYQIEIDKQEPLYWWKEFDTYKVGTVANSCSTMHKIAEKEFTLEDFSTEHLISDESIPTRIYSAKDMMETTIKNLNMFRELYLKTRDKTYWWQMIQLLPSNYNQTRNVMLNYEVLANIYRQRKNHKLDEWREVCKWIESLPYNELITVDSREAIKEELRKEIWKHMALLNTLKYIQIS